MPVSPEALTLTLSGFMSGYYFSGAYVFMPAVVKAPSPLVAQQWKRAWDVGRYVGKIVVTGTAASFAYLAYNEKVRTGNTRFQLLSLAAAVVGSIVPFTVISSYPFTVISSYPFTVISSYPFTVISSYPFTVISSYPFNEAINDRLGEINGVAKASNEKKDLKELVQEWGNLDFYRSWLAFLGTLIGVSAFLV